MKKRLSPALLALAAALAASSAAQAVGNRISGEFNGIQWTAQSLLTGAQVGPFNGTGTANHPGNSTYWPNYPAYSGVVGLLMDYGNNQRFVCSGSLLPDRQSILTAAHCVSSGFGTANPLSTTVLFQPPEGLPEAQTIYRNPADNSLFNPAATQVAVSQYFVNPGYTGEVIDQNDIAVLRMGASAPAWAQSYGIYTNGDLTGQRFNVAGYGRLGSGAGVYTPPNGASTTGRLRQGDNKFDYAWGDAAFGGFFTTRDVGGPFDGQNFFGFAEVQYSYVSDFDSGLFFNDMSGIIPQVIGAGAGFVDTGLGNQEVGVAGGDSGGPSFINGMVSSVNSYGLTFGAPFGDVDDDLNSSFGEFSGYVPTYIHTDFINASMVPEPGTYGLMALGLFAVGAMARRRRG